MAGPQLHGTIGFCGKGWHMRDHRAELQKEQMTGEKEVEELGKAMEFRRLHCTSKAASQQGVGERFTVSEEEPGSASLAGRDAGAVPGLLLLLA